MLSKRAEVDRLELATVEATLGFYEKASRFARTVLVPGEFGELDTGATKLAFAANAHVAKLFPIPFHEARPDAPPPPVEVGLVTDDVPQAFAKAVAAGAVALAPPTKKPWGQIVGYVRDLNGFLIELCTPMA